MTTTPADDMKRFADQAYTQWEQGMTAWWDQILDSADFLGASGRGLSTYATTRKQYESSVDEQMARMHLPSRGDVTRLARIATLLEDRLLQMEDSVLELKDLVARRDATIATLEKEVIQARVEAAEARIELREQLSGLHAKLAALEASAKPAAKPRRTRKTAAKPPAPKSEG